MNIIGIIAEYNPLHNGHIYHIKKIKELYPNSIIILVTNSFFTQRGDIQLINKYDKTTLALNNNIDLVIELPIAFSIQSADTYAYAALNILNNLKINTLVFGSESNNIEKLKKIASLQINNPKFDNLVKEYIKTGINYPTALNNAIKKLTNLEITEPNDLLAISYIKEIIKNNYNINPISIQRIGSYNGQDITNNITSASNIRNMLYNTLPIDLYIPTNISNHIHNININMLYPYLKYKIITENNLSKYLTVDEGIESRIKKSIIISNTWEELITNIKTKRYTYNKINRTLLHILLSLTKEDKKEIKIDYIKILGFNKLGKEYLNKIKKEISLPIIFNYQKNFSKTLDFELKTAQIYNLITNYNINSYEFSSKPINFS